jgi:hypothetical protein
MLVVLVAFNMYGYYMAGSTLSSLTRIIPRMVTSEGLERQLGEPGSSSRLAYSGRGGRPGCDDRQEIYPNLLRRFAGQKPNKQPNSLHPQGRLGMNSMHLVAIVRLKNIVPGGNVDFY